MQLTLLFIFTAAVSLAKTSSETGQDKKLRDFSTQLTRCLDKGEEACLRKFITSRMYFPEQKEFGCSTSDTKRNWYATPEEFAKCVLHSNKKRTGCGELDLTLREVLRECFSNPKVKLIPSMNYFESPSGSVCHTEEKNGELLISSIGCGC